jgi:hypothetical protein
MKDELIFLENDINFDEISLDYIISNFKDYGIVEADESECDENLVNYVLKVLKDAQFVFYKRGEQEVAKVIFSKKEHTAEAALSAYIYTRENLLKDYKRVELLEFKSDTLDGVYYGMFIVDL